MAEDREQDASIVLEYLLIEHERLSKQFLHVNSSNNGTPGFASSLGKRLNDLEHTIAMQIPIPEHVELVGILTELLTMVRAIHTEMQHENLRTKMR